VWMWVQSFTKYDFLINKQTQQSHSQQQNIKNNTSIFVRDINTHSLVCYDMNMMYDVN